MFKKLKKFISVGLVLTCVVGFSSGCVNMNDIMNEMTESYNSQYADVEEYMLKSGTGKVLTLPIQENPISVIIENLSEEDKKEVIRAVNDLDEISTNIDYKILEKDDVEIYNKIYITDGEVPVGSLGQATFDYNNFTGKINYPIQIVIDAEGCKELTSTETGENAICAVTKHELAHTLGFKDLYEDKYRNESIMYHTVYLEDYTEGDEYRIRQVYGGERENLSDKTTIAHNFSYGDNAKYSLGGDVKYRQIAQVYEPAVLSVSYDKNKNPKSKNEEIERGL